MKKQIYFIAIAVGLFSGCKKTAFETVDRTSGSADFKRYIAVGNSLTQGYQDGGLYEEGQQMSYPAIIAKQMSLVQPSMEAFKQPIASGNGSGSMRLAFINGKLSPIAVGNSGSNPEDATWSNWGNAEKSQKYNNLGVAGIKMIQAVNSYPNDNTTNAIILGGLDLSVPILGAIQQDGNPYSRFLNFGEAEVNVNVPILGNLGNIGGVPRDYLSHVKQSGATFFTCWLGNNDALGYVLAGGVPNVISNATIGLSVDLNALSDANEFAEKYDAVIEAFYDQGAQGVCATLPNATSIPYVTTFPIEKLKSDYYYNTVWITDLNGAVRQATNKDYVLLHASAAIALGKGTSQGNPFANGDVLDEEEAALAQNRTMQFNSSIRTSAAKYGYPVADMYTYMNNLSAGFTFEGIDMSIKYIEGGTFSLDGVHPNPRGYAVVANEFIRVINEAYGSNIPKVSVGNYRGIKFP